jgi:hypothetical protein
MNLKGRKKYEKNKINLSFNGNTLAKVKEYKYLGVIIDNKVNWNQHTNYIIKKLHTYIPIFYEVRWYTTQKVCIQLLKVMVMSTVLYAIEIYGNNSNMTKINSIINKILKIISNNKENNYFQTLKQDNNILQINDYYKLGWNKITHDIIHNSFKLPKYFKNLIDIVKNRNGLLIKTRFRDSKFGDNLSFNIIENNWNSLQKEIRDIQNKHLFIQTIITNYIKSI